MLWGLRQEVGTHLVEHAPLLQLREGRVSGLPLQRLGAAPKMDHDHVIFPPAPAAVVRHASVLSAQRLELPRHESRRVSHLRAERGDDGLRVHLGGLLQKVSGALVENAHAHELRQRLIPRVPRQLVVLAVEEHLDRASLDRRHERRAVRLVSGSAALEVLELARHERGRVFHGWPDGRDDIHGVLLRGLQQEVAAGVVQHAPGLQVRDRLLLGGPEQLLLVTVGPNVDDAGSLGAVHLALVRVPTAAGAGGGGPVVLVAHGGRQPPCDECRWIPHLRPQRDQDLDGGLPWCLSQCPRGAVVQDVPGDEEIHQGELILGPEAPTPGRARAVARCHLR
mmetsp:Transcript_41159/g.107161  ORF Transcript_41159/g.107161 Transcript_41159/m.107161 type:complete len:337 (-) Transcript_41159:20-1030(-)